MKSLSFLLIILVSVSMFGCEACDKTWRITGTITAAGDGSPIEGVTVIGPPHRDGVRVTDTTNSEGTYSATGSNYGGIKGLTVQFELTGYATVTSDPFTDSEGGISRCSSYTITRDAALEVE